MTRRTHVGATIKKNVLQIGNDVFFYMTTNLERNSEEPSNQGERPMGVEPTIGAWEATVLPLHYGRKILTNFFNAFGNHVPRFKVF